MFQIKLGHVAAEQNPVIDILQNFQVRIGYAQDLVQAEAMKSAEPYAFGAIANSSYYAGLHLAGGFVCESQSQDVFTGKLGIRFEQVANALGNDARLAGSGAGDDEQGALTMLHSEALLEV
jgi:hypothetical protein